MLAVEANVEEVSAATEVSRRDEFWKYTGRDEAEQGQFLKTQNKAEGTKREGGAGESVWRLLRMRRPRRRTRSPFDAFYRTSRVCWGSLGCSMWGVELEV